ncbi:hypothetical protein Cfor_11255 [Coptotermes formosanus]|uniref:ECSIT N-terminal domain-containing protein n=1 Tax=Coptotermes formosanus TaxID=36987 RepID=A0A6L2PDR0_COPFO|nr:hypothetical protein Cfor_11255 [Coptotermes formosanus]
MYRNCVFRSVTLFVKSATMLQWHTTCPFSYLRRAVLKPWRDTEWTHVRLIHLYKCLNAENTLVTKDFFENIQDKSKETFLDMIHIFESKGVHRRGHVEFIYAALRHMEEFGVHKDLDVYKSLIDILPKGKFIPTNIFQAEFQHYPKQQQCIVDLLDQMEDNGKYL